MPARPPLLPLVVSLLLVLLALALSVRRVRPRGTPAAGAAPAAWVTDLGQHERRLVDLPPPSGPFPQQLTACRPRVHVPINGGCWRKLADGPPCEEAYLWQGACYLPVMKAEATPTSLRR